MRQLTKREIKELYSREERIDGKFTSRPMSCFRDATRKMHVSVNGRNYDIKLNNAPADLTKEEIAMLMISAGIV